MIIKHRAFFKAVLPQMPANVVQVFLNSASESATKLANVIVIAHSRPAAGAAGASFTRAAGVFAASRRRTPAGVFAA